MSDTPEVSAPAVAAPAPAAPVAAPAVSAPVAEASAVSPAESSEAISAPAASSAHESFDWDGWEGSTDTFPEDVQPWAQKVSGYHTQRYDSLQSKNKSLKDLYDAILVGGEDPRIAQFDSDKEAWGAERTGFETKQQELQASWDQDKQKHSSYEQAVYQYHVNLAEKQLDDFVQARPEILKDEAKYALFSELLDEDWDLPSAGKLLEMPAAAVQVARKARTEGVPAAYAIQFAEKQAPPQVQKPQPRPAATITSGAVSRMTPHVSSRGMGDAKSLDESRAMASARALKLHK